MQLHGKKCETVSWNLSQLVIPIKRWPKLWGKSMTEGQLLSIYWPRSRVSKGGVSTPDIPTPGGDYLSPGHTQPLWKGPGTRDTERTWDQIYHPHPPPGQTDTCENITFPKPRLRAVITFSHRYVGILTQVARNSCLFSVYQLTGKANKVVIRSGNVWCKNLVVKFYVKFSCDEPMNWFFSRIFESPGLCYDFRRSLFYISGTQNLFHVIKMDIDNHLKTREETLKRIGGLKGKKISLFDLVHDGQTILIIYFIINVARMDTFVSRCVWSEYSILCTKITGNDVALSQVFSVQCNLG